jgi:hypothetical protein
MDLTSNGDIVVTGAFEGLYSDKMALFKFNSSLDLQWYRSFSMLQFVLGKSVVQTPDDGFIITGFTSSSRVHPSMFLVKTDSEGRIE